MHIPSPAGFAGLVRVGKVISYMRNRLAQYPWYLVIDGLPVVVVKIVSGHHRQCRHAHCSGPASHCHGLVLKQRKAWAKPKYRVPVA
jgi:hypothetical protein